MYQRPQLKILQKRINGNNLFIQIITGPRQIGKTTLVEQFLEKYDKPFHFVSADAIPSTSFNWISQQWETARTKLKIVNAKEGLLVIDEIQKINNWSESVKKEWDKDKSRRLNLKVILLGSSAILIEQGLTESLTGRFELIKMPHWNYKEMNKAFGYNENQFVWFGGFPGAAAISDDEKRWKDYVLNSIIEPTISKDILMLTRIQKPALLKNLFELGCIYSGQPLSYTKILGQLTDSGNTTTLTHYQSVLNQVWLLSGIQKFSNAKHKTKSTVPKWQVYNSALQSVYSAADFNNAVSNPEIWGRQVESAIGTYLINECRINGWNLYYWREGNFEIDYIVSVNNKIILIEVKTGDYRFHKGINEFTKKYKPYKTLMISNDSISWKDFLKLDLPDFFMQ